VLLEELHLVEGDLHQFVIPVQTPLGEVHVFHHVLEGLHLHLVKLVPSRRHSAQLLLLDPVLQVCLRDDVRRHLCLTASGVLQRVQDFVFQMGSL